MELLDNDKMHYDLSFLKELDDDEYLKEIVALFLESTPGLLDEIGRAVDAQDWQNIYQKVHKLKSSVGLLKMESLLKHVTEMESRAKAQNDMAAIKKLFESATSEYMAASKLLEREIA